MTSPEFAGQPAPGTFQAPDRKIPKSATPKLLRPSIRTATAFFGLVLFPACCLTWAAIRIMPLGDSITDGSYLDQYPGSYRIALWQLCVDAGIDIDFVGSLQNGPERLPDKDHEGHIGLWSDLETVNVNQHMDLDLESKLAAMQPQVVLVLLGPVDVICGKDPDATAVPGNLDTLVDLIASTLDDSYILLGTLIPSKRAEWESEITWINAHLPDIVAQKQLAGKNVSLVDLYRCLTLADIVDEVHPTLQGYAKMAQAWFDAIAEKFATHNAHGAAPLRPLTARQPVPARFLLNGRLLPDGRADEPRPFRFELPTRDEGMKIVLKR